MKRQQPIKDTTVTDETLLTRQDLSKRWQLHEESVSRHAAKGLRAIRLNSRVVRYRLSDVLAFENEQAA